MYFSFIVLNNTFFPFFLIFFNSIRTILKHWCNNGDPLGGSTITSETFFNSKSMELNFSNKTLYFINNLSINIEQSLFTKTIFTTKVRDHKIKCEMQKHRMKAFHCSWLIALWFWFLKIPLYTDLGQSANQMILCRIRPITACEKPSVPNTIDYTCHSIVAALQHWQ